MNIVIVGAGDIGQHVASFLSSKGNNVILVDTDLHHLEKISQNIDVGARVGSGTDWQLLEELYELTPDLLFALTNDDETNLVCCSIAKNLGYPKVVARVRSRSYLSRTRLDFGRLFCVDHFICPEQLVAQDIFNYATESGAVQVENFAHGSVQMRTLVIPETWRKGDIPLKDLNFPEDIVVGIINRKRLVGKKPRQHQEVIFPHGTDTIMAGDEVTFIGDTKAVINIHTYFGAAQKMAKSVVIIGGSLIAYFLAKDLDQRGVDIKIIDIDSGRCQWLAEQLPRCTILHNDGTDLNFLKAEHVESDDLVVACTRKDEVNIIAAMVAQEAGCENVLASITNASNVPLIEKLNISHRVSPLISATNKLFSLIRTDSVTSMVTLYDEQAEILELKVSEESRIVGIPIAHLAPSLPNDFLFAVIQNRGRVLIANGDRILSPGDTVIVISRPKHIEGLRQIF
ncbi:MAG: Trk system potassium transporter TrkA [Chlamydiota bacterium]